MHLLSGYPCRSILDVISGPENLAVLIDTVLINRGKLGVIYRQVGMGSDWGVNLTRKFDGKLGLININLLQFSGAKPPIPHVN